MSFLKRLVDDLVDSPIPLGDMAVVTPNRRAGLFLKKHIEAHPQIKKPLWLPEFFAVQDFIAKVSDREMADSFSLIFRLYAHYTHCFNPPRPFDTYYQWGQIVLSDFNEIDLYLIDRDRLFKQLKQFSDVDAQFSASPSGSMVSDFVAFAANLEALYQRFTRDLEVHGLATSGMALRRLVEQFTPGDYGRWKKIIFAGFNALSRSEEALIRKLVEVGLAEVYWDMDGYFVDDPKQEAGHFLREHALLKDRSHAKWMGTALLDEPKHVEIIGVSGRVAQAKVLGYYLENDAVPPDETAVVLPDESLLFPVLHAVPELPGKINVTMGYPLKNTALYTLITAWMEMQINSHSAAQPRYAFRDVQRVLMHPYVLRLGEGEIRSFIAAAQTANQVFIKMEDLRGLSPCIAPCFAPVGTASACIDRLKEILRTLVNAMKDDEAMTPEVEMIYQFYTRLERLSDVLLLHEIALELKTFWHLFRDILETATVPFLGEPLQGLQVMGLLETRALDFKNVYLLSANEGTLPSGQSQNSFIPNEVRRDLGMITHEHEDAIFAYYFYRLLAGAQHIHIFYNTVNDAFGKGERSRFIDQLLFELKEKNSAVTLRHRQIQLDAQFERSTPIVVPKTEEIRARLLDMDYSPTRLQSYVACPLKFYFRYLLKLSEQDEVVESADARTFGNVIHEVLERLYAPYEGRPLKDGDITVMKSSYKALIETVYSRQMGSADITEGRNYLYCRIIEALVANYLKGERPGLVVLAAEGERQAKLDVQGDTVRLTGTLDRLERQGSVTDIIDFKTGRVDTLSIALDQSWEVDPLLAVLGKNSQILQLLFYFVLAAESGSIDGRGTCRLGIYSFKEQKGQGKTRFLKPGKGRSEYLTVTDDLPAARAVLRLVFKDLFNLERPFVQTEDTQRCTFCPFTEICGR